MPANQPVVDVALEPKREPDADTGLAVMIERLALNPSVDVAKLEKIIELQERILDRNAEAAFNAAFATMQAEIPEIDERGAISSKSGGVQSRYAKNEDIQRVLKPILLRHGFALSFKTEWPDHAHCKLIGILTHRDGHARQSEFVSKADESGSKNAIQGLGSAISYGHRYTTCDLLNITSRDQDDDGASSERGKQPPFPDGFESWFTDLTAVAEEGTAALEKTWKASKREFREYLTKHNPQAWATLKNKAARLSQ